MTEPLRIGIIGASLERGWARDSHVPAVQKLAGLELAAVTARDRNTTDAVARAFGAERGFADVRAMVRDPAIDVVTVAVRVFSAHIYSGTVAFGRRTGEADLYLEDAANGATYLTIHGGHAMDAAVALLGGLADVASLASIQYPEVEIEDQGREHQRSIPDHVLVQSHLQAGGVVSAEMAGGRPLDTPFRFEMVGDHDLLALDGAASRGFQSGRLTLSLNGNPQSVDEGELVQLPDPAFNVGGMYTALRDDIARGNTTVPNFDHAVLLTRLVTDVSHAAATGARVEADCWPTD